MLMPKSYRWRKTTDINREYAVFELLVGEKAILDAGFSEAGVFEVAFNTEISGVLIEWDRLRELIEDGRKLAELDR
ncbi:hypothetical protein [Ferribacterium limneticum]|uniref:hypothetical protein n=1 Tax=Ferribacterium limneticum TaxID=76259 RepID=UPI001CF911B3|nr:hypothetical protein [Ferribacterium limneticum]UCV21490.1 hypothetical protein KI613_13155 [Ferribacterium limneticum]